MTGEGEPIQASGGSLTDNRVALLATLAEAAERNVWSNYTDYFQRAIRATPDAMKRHPSIAPERFVGIPSDHRQNPDFFLAPEQEYLWIRGESLITHRSTWVPAQTVAGGRVFEGKKEPMIREQNTNGLATRPLRRHAILYGALELIERDAYMIMWLNQLSLPRIDHKSIEANDELARLIERCSRYRIKVHLVEMLTDAPTHAMCAVLEDETGLPPALTLGLRAHWDPAQAAESAIMEALRMRKYSRLIVQRTKPSSLMTKISDIGHTGRLAYWMEGNRSERLRFLIEGKMKPLEASPADSEKTQLQRIIAWCVEKGYEFVSVPLTRSKGNATPWHIEMAIIPELQPMHLIESHPHSGGVRLREIPRAFGFEPRNVPYLDEPHPFA